MIYDDNKAISCSISFNKFPVFCAWYAELRIEFTLWLSLRFIFKLWCTTISIFFASLQIHKMQTFHWFCLLFATTTALRLVHTMTKNTIFNFKMEIKWFCVHSVVWVQQKTNIDSTWKKLNKNIVKSLKTRTTGRTGSKKIWEIAQCSICSA